MAAEPSPTLRLAGVEGALEREPHSADLHCLRASILAELGRDEDATSAYIEALRRAPAHFDALNGLGGHLYRTDFRTAARTVYRQLLALHPESAIALVNLANALLENGEAEEAETLYRKAVDLAPDDPDARQGLANALQGRGETEAAEVQRRASYARRRIARRPYRGEGRPRRVLELVSGVGGNVPTRFLLDETAFEVATLMVEADGVEPIPPHDIVFNAVGDPDLAPQAVDAAARIAERLGSPVLNAPARVRPTGRASVGQRLSGIPHLRTPRVARVAKREAAGDADACGYPLLVRSPGFHTGRYFERADGPGELAAALERLPGDEALVIGFLDGRDAQGLYRKYRAIFVGGEVFPLHLAVSKGWKTHYFSSEMAASPALRAEEARYLDDPRSVIGPAAMEALHAVAARLRLDFGGIDFGLSAAGEVLLYEANATMLVSPPPPDRMWHHRRPAAGRVLAAFRAIAQARAAGG